MASGVADDFALAVGERVGKVLRGNRNAIAINNPPRHIHHRRRDASRATDELAKRIVAKRANKSGWGR